MSWQGAKQSAAPAVARARSNDAISGEPAAAEDPDLIQVYVRIRAPGDGGRCLDVCEMGTITVHPPGGSKRGGASIESFTYDRVGGEDATQEGVFEEAAKPIADACLAGYNGTVLCYGQTGAGKTYTMCGPPPHESEGPSRGLLARVVDHLFAAMTAESTAGGASGVAAGSHLLSYNVTCSFLGEDEPRCYPRHCIPA